jgi:hypothetical protein
MLVVVHEFVLALRVAQHFLLTSSGPSRKGIPRKLFLPVGVRINPSLADAPLNQRARSCGPKSLDEAEYYLNEFEVARHNHDYPEMQELELRCDGIAVTTLEHLGLEPASLVSAIAKLKKFNAHPGSPSGQNQTYVSFNDRVAFIYRMIEFVSGYSDVKRAKSLAKI